MLHADAQPRHAVRDRIAPARQAWGPLVRPFFRKKAVSLATKAQVLQSLVASRLTYNMHVLTKLSPLVLQEWEASMRCKADAGWDGPLPLLDQHIVWVSWSSGPWDQLHVDRLRYAKRLVQPFAWSQWFSGPVDRLLSLFPHLVSSALWPVQIAFTRGSN